MSASRDVKQYRSIWISDVHLGTRGCKAEYLLDFLKHNESDHLYLVGDIVDGWRLRKTWYWPQAHNDVVQKILRRARKGVQVYYIPGNHDEAARDYAGLQFGGVQVVEEMIHVTADGRRLLVTHGDRFDVVVKYARWLAFIGDNAYVVLLQANTLFNWVRRKLGFPYWSLSAFLKHKTKTAVEFIGNYETALGDEARRRKVDGVVCGHIHTAEIRDMEGILYCNDGDWVESCTALVEHPCGRLEIIDWAADIRRRTATTLPARIPAKEKTEKEKAAKESVAA
ncbi:UDP-2,3-diacylglucosamine diphosphatase [Azospirillum brasilense]|uniref:UDP-2,3-diacylglucosamine diphosphatase n=1 Tax=Azospirillum brasilense TaxID=192 RepID=A0A0P0EJ42_AZOBR|nr:MULTISPECIES: UDP-2,3-diacylglucosamine diphosphatase [Azospirillum]ALJ35865.1 UDP-2,3-diacylglucosamine hydrolase [Azospirillum brasilense]MDW7552268.1 UDP-2,3-diacylglucosamine diphosphatase [Azospirillum brasilense]MDW7593817.1 UDP-2,3-diacylglucosamine diphosphatase [Azospirillum brasilense]MDW7628764.1 UDP-2,3-diacylglucosamine diphosphatase [Azospirillum brasilense]MDX5954640.1 UDP-2,3-diacylglucosamine diphosphatase [Azospirillum brasilense]